MVKVKEKNTLFGIIEDGKEVVPFVHKSKESAVEEWVYFQKVNITRQFLQKQKEIKDIYKIAFYLNGC